MKRNATGKNQNKGGKKPKKKASVEAVNSSAKTDIIQSWPPLSKEKSTWLMQQYLSRHQNRAVACNLPLTLQQSTINYFDQKCIKAFDLSSEIFAVHNTKMHESRQAINQQLTAYFQAIIQHSQEYSIVQAVDCFDQICTDEFDLESLTDHSYCELGLLFKMLDQCIETADSGAFRPLNPIKAKIIWEKNRCDPLILALQDLQGSETKFGIKEKILRGQEIAGHQLTAMDLRRTLCLMQLQDTVSVCDFNAKNIGLLLHSHRIEKSQTITSYTIPILVSKDKAWLSAIFNIDKNSISVLIAHSLPMFELEKKQIITIFEKSFQYQPFSTYPAWRIAENGITLIATEIKSENNWSSGDIALFNIVRHLSGLTGAPNPHLQEFLTKSKSDVVNFENLRRTIVDIHARTLKFTTGDLEKLPVPRAIIEYFTPVDHSAYYPQFQSRQLTADSLRKIIFFCTSPGMGDKLLVSVMNLMPFLNWQAYQEKIGSHFAAELDSLISGQIAEARLKQALRWCGADEKNVYLLKPPQKHRYQLIWEQVTGSLLARIERGLHDLISRHNSSYQNLFRRISAEHKTETASESFDLINWEKLAKTVYDGVTKLDCWPHKDSTLNQLPKILRGDVIVVELAINHQPLTPIMIENIATIVKESRTIRKLFFYYEGFGADISVLTTALAHNQFISTLCLNFKIDSKGLRAISDMLAINSSIQELDMMKIENEPYTHPHPLTIGLQKNTGLKWLRIPASNTHVKAIFSALSDNHTLAELFFHNGNIDAKLDKTLFDGLSKATALKRLEFSSVTLSVAEACSLALALTGNMSLETLDLGFSDIGDLGASAFACMLSFPNSLRKLVLCHLYGNENKIGVAGLKALEQVLPTTKLESLTLGGNFSQSSLEELIKCLKENSSILKLDISAIGYWTNNYLKKIERLLSKNRLAIARDRLTLLILSFSPLYSPIHTIVTDYVVDEKDTKNYFPKLY